MFPQTVVPVPQAGEKTNVFKSVQFNHIPAIYIQSTECCLCIFLFYFFSILEADT